MPRSPKRKYKSHRARAMWAGIPFLLTFEEWWEIWQASGHWEERGRRKGQYCMARFGDKGGYEVGNVRICTTEENHAEFTQTPEQHAKLSQSRLGNKNGRG